MKKRAEEIENRLIELRKENSVFGDSDQRTKMLYEKLRMQRRGMLWAIGDIGSIEEHTTVLLEPEEIGGPKEERLMASVSRGEDHITTTNVENEHIRDEELYDDDGFKTLCGIRVDTRDTYMKTVTNQTQCCDHCKRVWTDQ